jgi:hypothetical protein
MRPEVKFVKSKHLWLLALIAAIAMPAGAQIPAKGSYGAAIHDAIREIARDPCNASGKFASLLPPIVEAARKARAGTDDLPELLQRIADTGCRNSTLTVPQIELLLSAGKLGFLDACAYSPAKDYSVELAMARTHYHPLGVSVTAVQFREVPCMADFIAALLTNQPVSQSAASAPATPETQAPAPTRRRRT